MSEVHLLISKWNLNFTHTHTIVSLSIAESKESSHLEAITLRSLEFF